MGRMQAMGALNCARVFGLVIVLAACGDVTTPDTRGYTKAPLERPALMIRPEPRTIMDELGDPILPGRTVQPEEKSSPDTQSGEH